MANNKKTSKIKKPNFILFFLCYLIVAPIFKFKYKTTYDRFGLSDLKGPALITVSYTHLKSCRINTRSAVKVIYHQT